MACWGLLLDPEEVVVINVTIVIDAGWYFLRLSVGGCHREGMILFLLHIM